MMDLGEGLVVKSSSYSPQKMQNSPPLVPGAGSSRRRQNLTTGIRTGMSAQNLHLLFLILALKGGYFVFVWRVGT